MYIWKIWYVSFGEIDPRNRLKKQLYTWKNYLCQLLSVDMLLMAIEKAQFIVIMSYIYERMHIRIIR